MPASEKSALEEMKRLRALTWSALQREALEVELPVFRVRAARTRDELRLLILREKFPQVGAPTGEASQGADQTTRGAGTPRQSPASTSETLTRTSDERST